jgi:hypothetical protein
MSASRMSWAEYLLQKICNFKDSESKMNYLFQLWDSYDARIPDQGVSECRLTPTKQFVSYIMANYWKKDF